jgi:hypothetical protein
MIVFSDESKIHASQFLIRFVRRYVKEELRKEYCIKKKSKYAG